MNFGSGNEWLAAWWHQAITWTNGDFCGIHLTAISQQVATEATILYNELKLYFKDYYHITQAPMG